jgi:hypothetical protein
MVSIKLLAMGKEKNVIHSGRFPQGIKNAAFSNDYKVSVLEKIASDNSMSVNQLLMALFGQSLKQYMVSKKDIRTTRIRVAMQCMIRQTPNLAGRIQMRNNLSMKIAYIDLNTDIDKEIKKVKLDRETA